VYRLDELVQAICLIVRAWCAYAPSDTHLPERIRCIYMVCPKLLFTCALVNHSHRDRILSSLYLWADRSHHTKVKDPYQASSSWFLVCICQQILPVARMESMVLTSIADSSLFFSLSSKAVTSSFIFCLLSLTKERWPDLSLLISPLSCSASTPTLFQRSIVCWVFFEAGCEICSFEVLRALLVVTASLTCCELRVEGACVDLSAGVVIVCSDG
jgi:hypothetical protein